MFPINLNFFLEFIKLIALSDAVNCFPVALEFFLNIPAFRFMALVVERSEV